MKTVASVLALLALASSPSFAQNGSAEPPPFKIGVVNLKDIYNAFTKVADFTSGLEEEKKLQEAELDKIKKELEEKDAMRNAPGIGVKLKQNLTLECLQLEAKLKFLVEMWNQQVKQKLEDGVARLYNEIRTEVDAYAKEQKYTLVLKVEEGRVNEQGESAIDRTISLRNVLYVDPSYDITKVIVQRLNDKYAKEKANPPADPPKDGEKAPENGGGK